jgi:tetratricopeptide (TPR) repeat protein
MAQLASLFSLAAIYCYLRARQHSHQQPLWLFILLPCSMLLAIYSKENGALIPIFLLIIEATLFKFKRLHTSNIIKLSWVFFIISPIILGLFYIATHPGLFNHSSRSFSLLERLYTQQWIVLDYLKMIVLPNINDMGIFHDDIEIISTWQQAMPAALCHLALIGTALPCLKRATFISLGITWFYAGHLMESTAIPLELMFEHRNYLSLAGIAMVFGGTISLLNHKLSIKILAGILLTHLSLSSFERTKVWSNSTNLYQHNAANHPQSARAHISYANELLVKKEIDLAVKLLIKASELNPNDAGPLLHLIKVGCFGPLNYSQNFYSRLQQYYSNHPLSAYGQQSLHQTSYLYINDKCKQLNTKEFTALLSRIADHSPSKKRKAEMLLIKARLISKNNLAQANQLYQQSYQLNPDPRLLSEQAATLIAQQEIHQALRLVEKLQRQHNNLTPTLRRELKDLFAWYDKQREEKEKENNDVR